MASKPFASVIVPTYNRKECLARCLQGLARQSFTDFEVIVVDDASTDGTPESLGHPNYRVVRLERNRGAPGARNAGVKAARGVVVAFIDDDCVPEADWLEKLLLPYQDQAISGVGGRVRVLPDNYISFENGCVDRFGTVLTVRPIGRCAPGFYPYFVTCNASFRRVALEAIGLFDEDFFYYEEPDVCVRLLRAGHALVFENKALVYHHVIPGGKYQQDKFYWMARGRRRFALKNFSNELSVLGLVFFEAINLARNGRRFASGLIGSRKPISPARVLSTLKGAVAGYASGLAFLSTHHLPLRFF
ncbi:MAG: glycosyltransferase [Candidatus Diapherotrites archaeon]|uniref:Glycosyltransferase n=2 Tax=Candidatus Iainarchaeum sp. TaxID=3101447 RepID=A0A8T4L612_9ARCH|nr:glycosyltransferase [Candidatus Diapherotrites archaeon]